jgi:hypothetical protein
MDIEAFDGYLVGDYGGIPLENRLEMKPFDRPGVVEKVELELMDGEYGLRPLGWIRLEVLAGS